MSVEELFVGARPEHLGLIAGAALVLFGRHLYLLLLAVVGFALGWWLAGGLGLQDDGSVGVVLGVVFGAAAAALAFFLQRVVLAVAGFLIGTVFALWALQAWLPSAGPVGWGAVGLVGVVGALMLPNLFHTALVVLSSMVGAALIVDGASDLDLLPADWTPWLFLGVVLFGVLYQWRAGDRSRERKRRRSRRRDDDD